VVLYGALKLQDPKGQQVPAPWLLYVSSAQGSQHSEPVTQVPYRPAAQSEQDGAALLLYAPRAQGEQNVLPLRLYLPAAHAMQAAGALA